MDDKELLELAAKAAEISVKWNDALSFFCDENMREWSPLYDDGDALRLAVKLEMDLWLGDAGADVEAKGIRHITQMTSAEDAYAATRRAIVRAAAEIGKSL